MTAPVLDKNTSVLMLVFKFDFQSAYKIDDLDLGKRVVYLL